MSDQPRQTSTRDKQRHGPPSIGYRSYGSQTWLIKWKAVFVQAAVVLILLYGCTTWMLTKRMEKKFDGNYTRMLQAILNKSLRQHPTKQLLYSHLPPITKTIQVRRTMHAGHCWRSRDELISNIPLWTSLHGQAKAGRPARTYIQQLSADTGYSLEDLPEAMDERQRDGGRGSGRSAPMVWHKDDDDDDLKQPCLVDFQQVSEKP